MSYYVYKIQIEGITRYIGITNNLKRRQSEHRRELKKDDIKKFFYKKIVEYNHDKNISLETIYEFNNKTEAMRMEAFLILTDWFGNKELWQAPPYSFKYF